MVTIAFSDIYRGKRVLVTGHTGFKGSWLAEWLLALGAEVTGLSLEPPTEPALFHQLGLEKRLDHRIVDIRDLTRVRQTVEECRPDFVFHLAAQSLVRRSYSQPVETYATNVLGTVHVLEAMRLAKRACVVVAITTDKCYENREWVHSYREEDPMGGHDPYSSSKGMAELAISAYRRSFFDGHPVRIASARAGNVIGGGDWAKDRIVPDCIRALIKGEAITVRNKTATRPWQHVLEPLSGYLLLAARMYQSALDLRPSTFDPLCSAFNFGPALDSNRTVAELVKEILKLWPGTWEDRSEANAPHEAGKLNLATDKAAHILGWQSVWGFEQTVEHTVTFYRQNGASGTANSAVEEARRQIERYCSDARLKKLTWAL